MASGDLLLLRAHGGAPVLARAFACRLLVPGRRRSGLVSPLAASKVGIADVVGRVRSGDADQKRRRRDAEEGVATRRELFDEEEEEENGGETGGVDGSYLSETR
jgi:ATP-dependent RNA helicase MSS116